MYGAQDHDRHTQICTIVAARAPHAGHKETTTEQRWKQLTKWLIITCIDANAKMGTAVGGHQQEEGFTGMYAPVFDCHTHKGKHLPTQEEEKPDSTTLAFHKHEGGNTSR